MKPHTDRNGKPMDNFDRVLIDSTHHASIAIVGADKSLLSHRRSDGQAGEERAWYGNHRLTILTEEMQEQWRQQQADAELERSEEAAEEHAQEQLNAAYR